MNKKLFKNLFQKTITVILADDHPLARAGVSIILSKALGIRIVGEAKDGADAMKLVAKLRPRILLLDLKMPGPSPVEVEKWVRENYPQTVTLVLTAHDRDVYLADMMDAGVAGYLCKNERAENLISAIRRAASGETMFTEEQFSRAHHWRKNVGEKWNSLTEREHEILELLVRGFDNKTISKTLEITLRTTSYHVTNILSKLEVGSRQEAIAWMIKYFAQDL
jgi:DNA-binding NarL/FixJ family response regulator